MTTTEERIRKALNGQVGHESLRALANAMVSAAELSSLVSRPPSGHYKVVNLYVNKDTGKVIVEYEDTPTE